MLVPSVADFMLSMKRIVDWLPLALGLALLFTLAGIQWQRIIRGQNDFAALYAGARLVGTAELYSRMANQAIIKSTIGATMDTVVYTRPPFYAVLLKPLALLPYLSAYAVFCVLCVVSVLWFVARFSKECQALPFYACMNIPIAAFLPQGQDTPLLLTFTGASILLTRRGRDFLAGMALSLCAIKFHLFLLIPLLLLVKKRWRIFCGATAGIAILMVLGWLTAGNRSLEQYLTVLRDPWINFSADMMPNLHGLSAVLATGDFVPLIEAMLSCAVLGTFVWICSRTADYEFLFALSLLGGLLVSYHSGISDQILLLPVFVLITSSRTERPLRIATALSVTPIAYFTGMGVSVVMPILLLVVLALAAAAVSPRKGELVPAVT